MLYSEGLVPESDLAAFHHSVMQQQMALQRMQQMQQMQQMQLLQQQGQPFHFPIDRNMSFMSGANTAAGSLLQRTHALHAVQEQQQILFQQNQLMQGQHAHQLMMMLQQQAQAQQAARPPALPSYDWSTTVSSPAHNPPNLSQSHDADAKTSASSLSSLVSRHAAVAEQYKSQPIPAPALSSIPSLAASTIPPLPLLAASTIPSLAATLVSSLQPKNKKRRNSEIAAAAVAAAAAPLSSFATVSPISLDGRFPLIGCGGKLPGQFDRPIGVTVHRGHIIVCDHDNHRVQVLRCWDGAHVRSFGGIKPSKCEGRFHRPQGVVVNSDHNMIVTDQGNHRLQVINYTTGQQVRTIGGFGEGACQFANPCGLAIHPSGQIAICDSGNHRIQILEANGDYVRCIGSYGRDPGQFKSPLCVSCSPDGQRLIVAEYGNLRVQVLRWSDGGHIFTINKYFKPKSSWCPSGVAVDPDGHVLIVNSDCNCIEMFHIDGGAHVRTIELAQPPVVDQVAPDTQLTRPRGLCLSEDLDIVVTDHGLNHVQVIPKRLWYSQ
jgi:DNA-binding beta-propeller fold protein YncE